MLLLFILLLQALFQTFQERTTIYRKNILIAFHIVQLLLHLYVIRMLEPYECPRVLLDVGVVLLFHVSLKTDLTVDTVITILVAGHALLSQAFKLAPILLTTSPALALALWQNWRSAEDVKGRPMPLNEEERQESMVAAKDVNGRTVPLNDDERQESTVADLCLSSMVLEPDHVDHEGWTPLMWDAQDGRDQCVRALLQAKASVDAWDIMGWTALMLASQEGHESCVRSLIDANANFDMEAEDPDEGGGWTALLAACSQNHSNCLKLLLTAGADMNHMSQSGRTPLMVSCERGHHSCTRALIDHAGRSRAQPPSFG